METIIKRSELLRLISHAKQLGFQDDVEHWQQKLKELEERNHG